jgi:hypothetical protein
MQKRKLGKSGLEVSAIGCAGAACPRRAASRSSPAIAPQPATFSVTVPVFAPLSAPAAPLAPAGRRPAKVCSLAGGMVAAARRPPGRALSRSRGRMNLGEDARGTPAAAPAASIWLERRLGLVYAALTALTTEPIALWPIPRAWDLIDHWARLTLYDMTPGDPAAALYAVKWALIPDLALDLAYLALSPVLSAEAAIRLAWIASIALPAWGAWRVNKALNGAPQPALLLVPAISYNLVVTLGLIDFALGMGLALHAFAWWLTIDRRRRWTRLVLFNAVAVALFFCHLAAWAALALIVALHEATAPGRSNWPTRARRGLMGAAHFAAALPLWALSPPIESRFGGPGSKLAALAAPMFSDAAAAGALATFALTLLLVAALCARRAAIVPAMRGTLWGLAIVVAATPSALGAGDFLDARLAVLLAYLVLASLSGPSGPRAKQAVALLALVVVVLRFAVAAPQWALYQRQAAEFRAAIGAVAPGSRVLVVAPPRALCPANDAEAFYRGLANFVVVDRRAMVSALFVGQGRRPIVARDPRLAATPWAPPRADELGREIPDWRELYDALIALHVGCAWRPDFPGLAEIGGTAEATVYRLR